MQRVLKWTLAAIAFLIGFNAKADDRVALVVGDSSYAWRCLENPADDADVDTTRLERAMRDDG